VNQVVIESEISHCRSTGLQVVDPRPAWPDPVVKSSHSGWFPFTLYTHIASPRATGARRSLSRLLRCPVGPNTSPSLLLRLEPRKNARPSESQAARQTQDWHRIVVSCPTPGSREIVDAGFLALQDECKVTHCEKFVALRNALI
jgi:hypothetical protein